MDWLLNTPNLIPAIDFNSDNPGDVAVTLQLLLALTILSLAPSILIMMTCFTRIVVVLGFVRTSLSTQQMPPNQVIVGLALFLTFFVMSPVISQINETAIQPYLAEEITQPEALELATIPLKDFMAKHTREKDLLLFLNYNQIEQPRTIQDIPLNVLVPAFIISELKTAFQIGFIIFVPFLIIDMIVASTLMSMGMMMLPPVMISLPFKVLLFILVDGWNLVIQSLLLSFH